MKFYVVVRKNKSTGELDVVNWTTRMDDYFDPVADGVYSKKPEGDLLEYWLRPTTKSSFQIVEVEWDDEED